jgi:hypothetical protein
MQEAAILVTGTLALACPLSRKALTKAVQEAREGDCKVMGRCIRKSIVVGKQICIAACRFFSMNNKLQHDLLFA